MGYLKCKLCGGRYDLQPGELPGDFENCNCGGELEFYDDRGHKRGYKPINPDKNKSKGTSPLMKLLIILVIAYVVFWTYGSSAMGIMAGMNGKMNPGTYSFFGSVEIIIKS